MGQGRERQTRSTAVTASGMVLVLLALAVFATWSAVLASRAGAKVSKANGQQKLYQRARLDVTQEESLNRKYQLTPSSGVYRVHSEAAANLVTALGQLVSTAGGAQRVELNRLLKLQAFYLTATHRVFAATDAGDGATALSIDHTQAHPQFLILAAAIDVNAANQTTTVDRAISELRSNEIGMLVATPLVFAVGLLLLGVFLRISRGHQRTITTRASRDALTGLPNRQCFYDRGALALLGEERRRTTTSVLVIDLDRFKELNDTLGHRYGDQLLRLIGPRISPLLRPSDTIARLGGDEFALLLPDIGSSAAAHQAAEAVMTALRQPFLLDTLTFSIDASCGHASSPVDGDNIDDLLQHADVAMYIAKAAHSGVAAYHPTLDIHTPRRLAVLNELPAAIRDGQLVLEYQPKIDIATSEIVGAEALVRWNHPTRGTIPPDEFIPLAEPSELIKPLTTWVLNTAIAQCRNFHNSNPSDTTHLSVAVNISARSLLDDNFPAEVSEALTRHHVTPRKLMLEVTETVIMVDPQRTHATLKKLHDLGVELSIDDFGTGYSSLAHLKYLSVNELKIDKSFVRHMQDDPNDAVIVQSVIDLAHNLGLRTVAEGIENEATLRQLTALGCDLAQGFHLAQPMPAEAFDEWLRSRPHQTLAPTEN